MTARTLARSFVGRRRGLLAATLGGLAAMTAGAALAQPDDMATAYRCRGNEPFWTLDVDGGDALLARPGANGVAEDRLTGEGTDLGFLDPPTLVWRGAAADGGDHGDGPANGELVAVITGRACLDTMADRPPYTHTAVLSLPDRRAVSGCCDVAAAPALVGSVWLAEEIGGDAVVEGLESTLRIETATTVSGNGGCNRYFGPVTIGNGAMRFGPLAATPMACPPAVDDQERRFLDSLSRVATFTVDGTLLVLADEAGTPLLRLRRFE